MSTYIKIDENGYGSEAITLESSQYESLSETDKNNTILVYGEIDDYNWKKFNQEYKLWIDDLVKKAEIYFQNNPSVDIIPDTPTQVIPFEEKKENEISRILMERNNRQYNGCPWNTYTVDTGNDSITMINSAVLMVNLNQWNNSSWKMKSGEFVSLNNNQVIDMALTVGTFIQLLFVRENELKTQIQNATTDEELVWEW